MSWWRNSVFYEVYLPSFCDGNGDGIGDFRGLISKLPYLHRLGVDCIWITPFYPSPRVDNGYDISDYYGVDEIFGTLDDFKQCIKIAQDFEIKIIIDVVINHTSTSHPWFIESSSSRNNAKRDWYIWTEEPNNWESFFGGSAWEFSNLTKQYYYHSFAKEQADLNWQNPEVVQAVKEMLRYWLSLGVAGFRFDVINNLTVTNKWTDNPFDENGNQIHQNDVNQVGIEEVLSNLLKDIKKEYPTVFTVGEISSDQLPLIAQYSKKELFDVTFNFNLGSIDYLCVEKTGNELKEMSEIQHYYPTLFFNSHDMARSWNRLAQEDFNLYQLMSILTLFNYGVSFLFQGEELALGDFVPNKFDEIRDIQAIMKFNECRKNGKSTELSLNEANIVNRDKSRGMIPWNKNDSCWIGQAQITNYQEISFRWYQDIIYLRKKLLCNQPPIRLLKNSDQIIHYCLGKYHIFLNFSFNELTIQVENIKEIIVGKYEKIDGSNIQIMKKGFIIWEENE